MRRKRTDHLSDQETEALRADLRAGMTVPAAAAKYNIAPRTAQIHKAKLEGRFSAKRTYKHQQPTGGNTNLCKDRSCTNKPLVGSPFCRAHQPQPAAEREPSIISPIPLKRLMARR